MLAAVLAGFAFGYPAVFPDSPEKSAGESEHHRITQALAPRQFSSFGTTSKRNCRFGSFSSCRLIVTALIYILRRAEASQAAS
jgi:hypothetical protein